jgi:threonine/homoserine/homoserine lactone efflux protein
LNPFQWLIGFLTISALISLKYNATWLAIVFAIFIGLMAIVFVVAYFYFGSKNPDLLRSEKYLLEKQKFDRGVVADIGIGLKISGLLFLKTKMQQIYENYLQLN